MSISAVQWRESAICIHIFHMYTYIPYVYIYSTCIHICIHIHTYIRSWTSLPTPPGRHRARSWVPCAIQHVPTSHLFYTWKCIYVKPNLPVHPTLHLSLCVHISILYVCISIPALKPGSSCYVALMNTRWVLFP